MSNPEGPRVLVIEDDRDVSDLLGSHLRRLGCHVTSVGTGEAGLAAASEQIPDVVLVDIVLPGIGGEQVLETLRGNPRTSGCRLVATSVLDAAELRDMGADAVLPKPFSRRDVARLLVSLDATGGQE